MKKDKNKQLQTSGKKKTWIVRSSAAEYLTFVAATGKDGVEAVYADGKNYNTKHYNLSAIISVGYKVNSERAVQFRKWATQVIQDRLFESDFDRLMKQLEHNNDKIMRIDLYG